MTRDQIGRLEATGLKATEENIQALETMAWSYGFQGERLLEAMFDASRGEFELLKFFGIRASAEGTQVKMVRGGITRLFNKDHEGQVQFMLAIIGN